ncbi:MAG: ribonuclease HII [Betaproteobacteria bacterium]|nr:ribonuclease HII [Betaproteobacteria bacterium]
MPSPNRFLEPCCGIDEAGRGPLAGPVFAACVILDPERPIEGLADSKKLSARQREVLSEIIRGQALSWCVASASVEEIDQHNILQATLLAMRRAVRGLSVTPLLALVDGNQDPSLGIATRTIVRGDRTEPAISAASILAKTARDALMLSLHKEYPAYGFDQHKGYPTAKHMAVLREHGATVHHRRSFAPVREVLDMLSTSAAVGALDARWSRPVPR